MDRQDQVVDIVCRRTVRFEARDDGTNHCEDLFNLPARPQRFAVVKPLCGAEEFDGENLFHVLDDLPAA